MPCLEYTREMKAYVHNTISAWMIAAKIFVIAKQWKKCMHPSTGECVKNCGYPYNGTVFGNRNEWIVNTCYNMDQPLKYYTNERSQMQKTTFWMILFMWKVQKKSIFRSSK